MIKQPFQSYFKFSKYKSSLMDWSWYANDYEGKDAILAFSSVPQKDQEHCKYQRVQHEGFQNWH